MISISWETKWFPSLAWIVAWNSLEFCGFRFVSMLFLWFCMDTIWFPGEHYMVLNMDTMWFPGGCLVVSMLTPHGFHMDIPWHLWFPQMEMTLFPWSDTTRWKQHHFHIISMGGNDVISRWKPHGFHVLPQLQLAISVETTHFVVSLLFPVISMVSIWTPHGLKCGHHVVSNVDTMCFPCRHNVISRKKHGNQHKNSSAWSQLASLLINLTLLDNNYWFVTIF